MPKRPEYAYKKGNYAQVMQAGAGVQPSPSQEATWNDIAAYQNSLNQAIQAGGYITQQMVAPSVVPRAQVDLQGIVLTDAGIAPGPDPRVQPVNAGRRRMNFWINSTGVFSGANEFGVTPGSSGVTSFADASDSDGSASSLSTSGANNDFFYITGSLTGAQNAQRRHALYHTTKIKLTSVAAIRLWIGMFDTQPTNSDTPAAANGVAVRFSTGSDTTFKLCGLSGGAVTTVDTQIVPAANTLYVIEYWTDASNVRCRINNSTVFSLGTGLPSSSTSLVTYSVLTSLTALAAAVKTLTHYNTFYSQS